MAQECMVGKGLHVNAVRAIVEIVRNGRMAAPGEDGEIVVTDLHNYVMPFIRYRTGDIAERGQICTCGNVFPIVRKVVGRSVEYFRAKDGNLIALSGFSDKFGALFLDDVVQFQFVDRGVGKLGVRIVPTTRFSQIRQKIMEQWLRSVADKVEIETV